MVPAPIWRHHWKSQNFFGVSCSRVRGLAGNQQENYGPFAFPQPLPCQQGFSCWFWSEIL
jgi:hypothetical protein